MPLTWIYGKHPMSLYVETHKGKQLLFKDLHETFSDTLSATTLNTKKLSVIEITSTFYSSVDVVGYKCLPKSLDNT